MPLGPYSEYTSSDGAYGRSYSKYKAGVRNSKSSRNKPSAYLMQESTCKTSGTTAPIVYDAPNTTIAYEGNGWTGKAKTLRNQALSKSYEKFVGKMKEHEAQLGASLAERKEAVNMIANRAGQLLSLAREIRSGNFRSLRRKSRRRLAKLNDKKTLSELWLEFHFGWEPLIGDIFSAVDVLQSPFPYGTPIKSASTMTDTRTEVYLKNGERRQTDIISQAVTVRHQGSLFIENPMLWNADRLGLVNPASIAWEVVPFSFVVDWFSNVGQVLGSSTDFLGCHLEDPCTTYFYRASQEHTVVYLPPYDFIGYGRSSSTAVVCERIPNIIGPSLTLKPLKGFSLTRGATAIALLVGFLK